MFYNQTIYPILDLDSCKKRGVKPIDLSGVWSDLGLRYYQLRAKSITGDKYIELAGELKNKRPELNIIANDFFEIALDNQDIFSGVHLGQDDFNSLDYQNKNELMRIAVDEMEKKIDDTNFITGISTHNIEQVQTFSHYNADAEILSIPWKYIAIGPIMQTESKPQGKDPVLTNLNRRDIFSYLSEKCFKKNTTKHLIIVLIGGLRSSNLKQIISQNFISQYGFFPMIAVIGSAMRTNSLLDMIKTINELRLII